LPSDARVKPAKNLEAKFESLYATGRSLIAYTGVAPTRLYPWGLEWVYVGLGYFMHP